MKLTSSHKQFPLIYKGILCQGHFCLVPIEMNLPRNGRRDLLNRPAASSGRGTSGIRSRICCFKRFHLIFVASLKEFTPENAFAMSLQTPHSSSAKNKTIISNLLKNVLQFLLISAHGRIPCNLVSKYRVQLAVHQGAGGMLVMCSRAEQLGHSLPYILYRNA